MADLAVTDFTSREYNHYPLSFVASPGEQMALRVEFDTDVFTRAGIATLVERFQHVLEVMAADPEQRLSGVDVLDESEHAQLDVWGNRAVLSGPAAELASIPALFAAQVARAPEAVAISGGGSAWTYRELDEASNRLAHVLAGRGAGPGRTVALLLPRSTEAIGPSWPCSRPVLPICRSIPPIRTTGSRSCWRTLPRWPRSPPMSCARAGRFR